jgi:hypothetical protein
MENNGCCNCANTNVENFCAVCGQKKYRRIDKKYLIEELQYTFLHVNKGFLYSIKSIIKNPGKTAKDFLDGHRVNHYKPILLAFLLAGISSFISLKLLNLDELMINSINNPNQPSSKQQMSDMMNFMSNYNSFIMMLFIPLVAVFTKLTFNSKGHNYYEHVIMNTFGQSAYLLLMILVFYPIFFFLKDNPGAIISLSFISYLFVPVLMYWFYKNVYTDMSSGSIILRILGIIGLGLIAYFVIIIITVIVMVVVNGPEAFLPKR